MFHPAKHALALSIYSFLALCLVACDETSLEEPLNRIVKVQSFQYTEHSHSPAYPGRLISRYESQLSFQVEGRLVERLVDIGSPVSKGATIAVLDSKDYDLASESLFNQKREAAADYQRAKNDLRRAEQLRADNFIGEAELDHAVTTEAASKAKLNALQAQYSKSLNARGYTRLISPADGIITAIHTEVGDVLTPRQTVAALAWDKNREFITALPEDKINALTLDQSVSIQFWAAPEDTFLGRVREISPIVDPDSQTYTVKLSLEAPSHLLKLGMSGYATFTVKNELVGLLPTSSLLNFSSGDQKDQVQVILVDPETGLTRAQIVTLGTVVGDQTSITTGLKEKDLVIVAGANKISPGEIVRILPAGT